MIEGCHEGLTPAQRLQRVLDDFAVMPSDWHAAEWAGLYPDPYIVRRWQALLARMPSARLRRFAHTLAREVIVVSRQVDASSVPLRREVLAQAVALDQQIDSTGEFRRPSSDRTH